MNAGVLAHGRGYEADLLGGWTFDPATVTILLAVAVLYVAGLRRARGSAAPARWQQVAFWAGWVSAVTALTSPLARLADDLFVAHMGQHILLTNAAIPLVLLGAPLVPWLAIVPRAARRGPIRRVATFAPARALFHLLRQPLPSAALYILVTLAWHVPDAYAAALQSETLHAAQHASFVATAVLFWSQIIDPTPFHAALALPIRILYLFAAGLPHHVLTSGVLIFSERPLYPIYGATTAALGVSPLSDQQLAGGIMIAGSFVSSLVAFTALFFLWLDREEREQRARESRLAASTADRAGGS